MTDRRAKSEGRRAKQQRTSRGSSPLRPTANGPRATGHAVKARIVGAGVKLGALARAVGVSNASITHYIQGKVRDRRVRRHIWIAFRSLSGQDITFQDFWDILAETRQDAAA